jgi:hypothetical protein
VDPFDWLLQHGTPVPLLLGSNREDASMNPVPSWCASTSPVLACPTQDPTMATLDATGYANAIHAEFDPLVGAIGSNMLLSANPAASYAPPIWALIAVDSDLSVGGTCSYREVTRAAAGPNGKPVFRYIYTHAFEVDGNLTPYQAFHAAEFPFVTGDPSFGDGDGNGHSTTLAETMLAAQMMGYWTRFAATGNPNGAGATMWPRYDATTGSDPMLQIDDTSTAITNYHKAQCDFYDANAAALVNLQ